MSAPEPKTHAVEDIEYQPHADTEFLKVQVAIVIDIRKVPHPLELRVIEAAVL